MFFVGCENNGKLGIVDTDDFVIDFFTPQELASFNVNIVGFDIISLDYLVQYPPNLMYENEYNRFKINSALALYRNLLKGETDMITGHYVVGLHDILYYINKCTSVGVLKCFSYVERYNMFVLVLKVNNGVSDTLALCRVMSDGTVITRMLDFDKKYFLSTYPIGSGRLYSKYCKDIPQDKLFIKVNYSDNNFILYEVDNFMPVFVN